MSGAPHAIDIAIVGGGMVGMSLGLALAQAGLDVAAIDIVDPRTQTHAAFDGRVSAIAFASARMLAVTGAWARMAGDAQPILDIVVSDGTVKGGASPLFMHFDHREIGDEPLGHIVENRLTRTALFATAETMASFRLMAPARVTEAVFGKHHVDVTLAGGQRLRAKLLIAADGRESPLRTQVGIKTVGWSYAQTGIVCTVEHEKPHHGVAQEYFLPAGPFAILPMTGNRSSLVWTEREDLAPAILKLNEADFTAELASRFTDFLGAVKPVGPRWSYPLSLHLATDYVAPRFALAGDAAHGIHPIAGQGLNLGLRDAAALAETIVEAARLGLDIGSAQVLERYQRWRRFDTTMLAAVTDGLNWLFSNDIAPIRAARDIGLAATGAIAPLRRFLMRHAGGDVGALPKLLRGESL